ncbi:MAG: hypothetical protein ACOY3E_04575 [Pseudomonadota bacterium]
MLASALLALTASLAHADGPRFTSVDVGLFGADSNDYDGDEARFRVRGSIGAGDVVYFPLALESTAIEFDDDYSVSDVVFTAGVGGRFAPIETMAIYGDASLAVQSISVDEDGGFDDEDYDDDGNGHLLRGGWRFQPTSKVELIAELSQRRISLDDSEETVKRNLFAVQINFTPMLGLGLEYHRDHVDYEMDYGFDGDYSTRFYGAYFRFSFK